MVILGNIFSGYVLRANVARLLNSCRDSINNVSNRDKAYADFLHRIGASALACFYISSPNLIRLALSTARGHFDWMVYKYLAAWLFSE